MDIDWKEVLKGMGFMFLSACVAVLISLIVDLIFGRDFAIIFINVMIFLASIVIIYTLCSIFRKQKKEEGINNE